MVFWGILGAGRIAHRFCKALEKDDQSRLYAIAGRSLPKLEAFQQEFPCEELYTDFQDLIDDPKVDAVYVSLPNSMHFEWVKKALAAGKAVLCEKPAFVSSVQAEEIARISDEKEILFMEAMKNRFIPSYCEMKDRIESGEFGRILSMDLTYGSNASQFYSKDSHFNDPAAGGCLWDSGIYEAGFLRGFFDELHPVSVEKAVSEEGEMLFADAALESGEGIPVRLCCSYDRPLDNRALIETEQALITIPDLHRPHGCGIEYRDGRREELDQPYDTDDFYSQIRHFSSLFEEGKSKSPILPPEDSVWMSRLLEEIRDFHG